MIRKFFYKRYFKIIPQVFYPRFETEQLVSLTLEYGKFFFDKFPLNVLEIGIGSGVISISLLDGNLDCHIDALDINNKAIWLSKINGKKYLNKKLFIFQSDLFEKVNRKYHLIIANLPYVGKNDYFEKQILKWDPQNALFSGEDGTILLERFFKNVTQYLKKDFLIALEISEHQEQKVTEMILKYLKKCYYFFEKDYQKLTRFVFIYYKQTWNKNI